jgi:hypothetical protein
MAVRSSKDQKWTHLQCNDLSIDNEALVATNKKITFRDTGLYVYSSADSTLDLVSDGSVQVTAAPASAATAMACKSSTTQFFAIERNDNCNSNGCIALGGITGGQVFIWADSSNTLRISTAQPTADTDGWTITTGT